MIAGFAWPEFLPLKSESSISKSTYLSIFGSGDRERWQPAQQCRLFPVPFSQGGYGSAPQPIVNGKRTLVRWQVQDSDWDRQNRLEAQRSQVRIERWKLYQMSGDATPHGSGGPRDKKSPEVVRGRLVQFSKRNDKTCHAILGEGNQTVSLSKVKAASHGFLQLQ
jgi:hypothetical protein